MAGKIDMTTLRDASGGDNEFVREILNVFLRVTPVYLDDLRRSIDSEDYSGMAMSAHKIKGSLGYLGMDREVGECKRLEKEAEQKADINLIKNYYESIQKAVNISLEEARSELQKIV